MATNLRARLVFDVLHMAVTTRKLAGVLQLSDQGSQYTAEALGFTCVEARIHPSAGSVGDARDNAMAEAFFATLKCELLDRRRLHTQAQARIVAFAFTEDFYNPTGRHSALGHLSPIECKARAMAENN